MNRLKTIVFFSAVCMTIHAEAQQPFTSLPLTRQGDMAALMVQGISTYLDMKLSEAPAKRASQWQFDFSSEVAFNSSIADQRVVLSSRLGASLQRTRPEMEILTGRQLRQQSIVVASMTIRAVRWKVLEDVWGEGILLTPAGQPTSRVILIPDADMLPEVLAGFSSAKALGWGKAQLLARAGVEVLIPVLASRDCTFSGNDSLHVFTNMPHREWIYRQGYEVGRHVIGYELMKIFAALDCFEQWDSSAGNRLNTGVAGYGEGGLLALYAGALDTRIKATLVSGYFGSQDSMYRQPIYRNVFGALNNFGHAELAAMTWPRKLLIENGQAPEVKGPPDQTADRRGAAPGELVAPAYAAARAEFQRAQTLVGAGRSHLQLMERTVTGPFSIAALQSLCGLLHAKTSLTATGGIPVNSAGWVSSQDRQKRTVREMEHNIQDEVRRCATQRDIDFWESINTAGDKGSAVKDGQRKRLAQCLGEIKDGLLPTNTRSRLREKTALWTSYDVVLDVLPNVFTYGILTIPNDLQPGQKAPVVVCQHGLEGSPFDVVTQDSTTENFHYYRGFGSRLAERGYITFSPQNLYKGGDNFRELQRKANPLGLTLYSFITMQHRQIVQWLASQNFIDPARIGFYGLSYGGKTAMYVPSQVQGYALSICSASFNEWIHKVSSVDVDWSYMYTNEYEIPEWDMGHRFSYAEMAALIAPRPFMVERGLTDGVGTDDWIGFEYGKVAHHYVDIDHAGDCVFELFSGGHTIYGKGTFEFLDKYLHPRQR